MSPRARLPKNLKNAVDLAGYMSTLGNDWYVFEGGRVLGPYSVQQLRDLPANDQQLISRRGLQQWYPVAELTHLLERTGQLDRATQASVSEFNRLFDQTMHKMATFAPSAQTSSPQVIPKKIGTETASAGYSVPMTADVEAAVDRVTSNKFEQQLVEQTFALIGDAKRLSRKEKKKKQKQDAYSARRNHGRTEPKVLSNSATSSPLTGSQLDELYILLRSRLRLGQVRKGALGPLLSWIFTAGMGSIAAANRIHLEARFHLQGDLVKLPHRWCAGLPIIAALSLVSLGKLILTLEEQNQYRATSPRVAGLLSIFPPLAIWYLQRSLNRHWYLHVVHASQTGLRDLAAVRQQSA